MTAAGERRRQAKRGGGGGDEACYGATARSVRECVGRRGKWDRCGTAQGCRRDEKHGHVCLEGSGGRQDEALRGIRGRDGGEDGRGKSDAHKTVQLLRAESVNSYPQWPVGYILS